MTKIVKEELKRIPKDRDYDAQGELRLLYNAVRRRDLKYGKTKEETLSHCIETVKKRYPSWLPSYEKNFFRLRFW